MIRWFLPYKHELALSTRSIHISPPSLPPAPGTPLQIITEPQVELPVWYSDCLFYKWWCLQFSASLLLPPAVPARLWHCTAKGPDVVRRGQPGDQLMGGPGEGFSHHTHHPTSGDWLWACLTSALLGPFLCPGTKVDLSGPQCHVQNQIGRGCGISPFGNSVLWGRILFPVSTTFSPSLGSYVSRFSVLFDFGLRNGRERVLQSYSPLVKNKPKNVFRIHKL